MLLRIQHLPDHKVRLTYPHFVAGACVELNSPIDALSYHIQETLGMKPSVQKGKCLLPLALKDSVGFDTSMISRMRKGTERIYHSWVYRAHVYSGIPLDELYAVANIEPEVAAHPRAVKREPKFEVV